MSDFHPTLSTPEIQIDAAQAFLLWCSSNFDCAATAHALNIPAVALQRVIDDENWPARVKTSHIGSFSKIEDAVFARNITIANL